MKTKLEENFNNKNSKEEPRQSISEYPATIINGKVNEQSKKIINLLNENTESNHKTYFSENIKTQSFSKRSQSPNNPNPIVNNVLVLQEPKTGVTFSSGDVIPITEKTSNSTNNFDFTFDSNQFPSLGEYNQTLNNKSNNFDNLGIEIPNYQDTFNVRNEENFYLSNADIVNIALSMNDNMNQNANDNFETNNITKEGTKKDEKNNFEYNDKLINELIDSNELNNVISTNEGEFNCSENITTKKNDKSYQTVSTNQPQLPLKENELNSIQATYTTDIYNNYFQNDYNFNAKSIQQTSQFQNDLTNIIQPSYTNVNMEFNQLDSNEIKLEKKVETKDSSTQTESSDLVLNVSLKISPFETKLHNISISSKNANSENENNLEEKNQNLISKESIDISSKPESQNQKISFMDFSDTYNLEMFSPSSFAKVSKMEHLEQKSENKSKNESIPKSEPEFNYDNIQIETQDNNIFLEQNVKIEEKPLSKEENKGNSLRYSILESSNNKEIDLANVYAIAESEILEENKKSSKDFLNY